MVSVNVSQLLLLGPGAVREFEFTEPFPDPAGELHLHGPIRGRARLTRTSTGILVHSDHAVPVLMECARCLESARGRVSGSLDEEFFPSTDMRSGAPLEVPETEPSLLIDAHHEIDLDEVLRQSILTNLPLRPLCRADCPGLCSVCGERLDSPHPVHADAGPAETPVDPTSPFAQLAVLLRDVEER
jgi:uncharacterized protein